MQEICTSEVSLMIKTECIIITFLARKTTLANELDTAVVVLLAAFTETSFVVEAAETVASWNGSESNIQTQRLTKYSVACDV